MKKIVLIGAGGFGREVASIIEVLNSAKPTYELLGFLDDGTQYHEGVLINGYPWLGKHDWILQHKEDIVCTCSIGNPEIKARIQKELTEQGAVFETIVAAGGFGYIAPYTEIGPGCVFYGGVTISVNCKIGAGVLMNQMVNIGHDTTIGDFTNIMPFSGISGNCKVGEKVNIGGHAFIIPGKKIGDGATVAAGSIVFSNVKAGTTVLGNPAKRMRELE
ncbi:MAG: NeuD/PglB/VioB family sugar acetyltransferase [Lachnospiraceae bacterium]|nr:NeuD/PglB/VioB family sugar acetyltransferase [Lachnospiraceae bacterium]